MYSITTDDLPMAQNEKARPLDEVLNELDDFVGMRQVKNSTQVMLVCQCRDHTAPSSNLASFAFPSSFFQALGSLHWHEVTVDT